MMRRRGRSTDHGARYSVPPDGASPDASGYFVEPQYRYNEVPADWRRLAREPWRVLFPDLEWSPPERE